MTETEKELLAMLKVVTDEAESLLIDVVEIERLDYSLPCLADARALIKKYEKEL